SSIRVIWISPGFPDYHWVARPDLDQRFGKGFTARLRAALLALDYRVPPQRSILELYGAKRFVPTEPGEYRVIETAARELGLLNLLK
ncbi:MAG: PhnD/SsuA/transferrin family substrate-binding protein, partial [Candidatus Limnocylindria bacterium]